MARKPLTETIRCPECSGERRDETCICHGTRWFTRTVICGCCYENHRAEDCPYYCQTCHSHHEPGDHRLIQPVDFSDIPFAQVVFVNPDGTMTDAWREHMARLDS
jgi:hypothetical protein